LTPRQKAELILRNLGMEGAFGVGRPAPDGTLVINRQDLLKPRRVTYNPASGMVLVESAEGRMPHLLERMHRRRGFVQPYLRDRIWGVLVEAFVVVSVVWALTGLWLWWEMRVTRGLGALFLAGGIAVFVFFLRTI
jgi:hypothetical protein